MRSSIFLSVMAALAGRFNTAGYLEAAWVMFQSGLSGTNMPDATSAPAAA